MSQHNYRQIGLFLERLHAAYYAYAHASYAFSLLFRSDWASNPKFLWNPHMHSGAPYMYMHAGD